MKIEFFDKKLDINNDVSEYYKIYNVPDDKIINFTIQFNETACNKNKTNFNYGRICLNYNSSLEKNNIIESVKSLDFTVGSAMLIIVNDIHKFVVTNVVELKNFYKSLTGVDLDYFQQKFNIDLKLSKNNIRKNNIEDDFKTHEE